MSCQSRTGYKETATGWIPADWHVSSIRDTGEILSGGTPSTAVAEYWNGDVPWCTPTDITRLRGRQILRSTERSISIEGLNNSGAVLIKANSLLVCTRATVGVCAINAQPMTTNQGFKTIVPNESFSPEFLYYAITHLQPELKRRAGGSTFLEISKSEFEKVLLAHPGIREQRQIAAILSTVDDKLDVITRQIEATVALKRGLTQTLFSRGVGSQDADGRWAPHAEFKDSELGEIPLAWRVCGLDDVVENLDKKRIPLKQADRAQRAGEYPYYGASGIIDWVDDFIFDGEFILLGEDGENVISRNLPLAFRASGKIWVNNHAHVFKAKEGHDTLFLVELLESLDYSHLASGTAQPKITQQALRQLRFAVPPLAEQERIGSILDSMESKIRMLRDKHCCYKEMKRGLMQKLLTGEWRVTLEHTEAVAA